VALRPHGGDETLVTDHFPSPAVLDLSGAGGRVESGVRVIQIEDRLSDDPQCLTQRSRGVELFLGRLKAGIDVYAAVGRVVVLVLDLSLYRVEHVLGPSALDPVQILGIYR